MTRVAQVARSRCGSRPASGSPAHPLSRNSSRLAAAWAARSGSRFVPAGVTSSRRGDTTVSTNQKWRCVHRRNAARAAPRGDLDLR